METPNRNLLACVTTGTDMIHMLGQIRLRCSAAGELLTLLREADGRVKFLLMSFDANEDLLASELIPRCVLNFASIELTEVLHDLRYAGQPGELILRDVIHYVTTANERLHLLEQHLNAVGLLGSDLMPFERTGKNIRCYVDDAQVRGGTDCANLANKRRRVEGSQYDEFGLLGSKLARSGISSRRKKEICDELLGCGSWKLNKHSVTIDDEYIVGKGADGVVHKGSMRLLVHIDGFPHECSLDVAVKKIYPIEAASQEGLFQGLQTFLRELSLQMKARHPCIVRTYGGYWPSNSKSRFVSPYIVSELMACNLKHVLKEGMLEDRGRKERVLRDVAAGLTYLHEHGIVHRDIKPENVLIRLVEDKLVGHAKITDFNDSRVKSEDEVLSQSMSQTMGETQVTGIGTYAYMAPEIAQDQLGDIVTDSDYLSASRFALDVWSFGVLVCVVAMPGCLEKMDLGTKADYEALAKSGSLAKMFVELVEEIGDAHIRNVAFQCLSWKAGARPKMSSILQVFANCRDSDLIEVSDEDRTNQADTSNSGTGQIAGTQGDSDSYSTTVEHDNGFFHQIMLSSASGDINQPECKKKKVNVNAKHPLYALRKHKHKSPVKRGISCKGIREVTRGTFVTLTPINLIDPSTLPGVYGKNDYIVEESKFYGEGKNPRWDDPAKGETLVGEWFAFCHNQGKDGFAEFFQVVDKRPASERPPHWVMPQHRDRKVIVLSSYVGYTSLRNTLLAVGMRKDDDKRNCLLGTTRRRVKDYLPISLE